jgi:Fe-S-cluster containining protein
MVKRVAGLECGPDRVLVLMPDQQLHTIHACKDCPGFCCRLFFLPQSPENMQGMKEEKEYRIRTLLGQMTEHEGSLDPSKVRELAQAAQILEMVNFGIEHFHRIEEVFEEEAGELMKQGEGFFPRYAYTCDQWDPQDGRCRVYTSRPWTCESFICGAATEGRVPTHKDFAYSVQITDEEAECILQYRHGPGDEGVEEEIRDGGCTN